MTDAFAKLLAPRAETLSRSGWHLARAPRTYVKQLTIREVAGTSRKDLDDPGNLP